MPNRAVKVIAAALIIDAIGGILFSVIEHAPVFTGFYWAVVTGTTVGYGDVTAHDVAGRIVAIVVMLTAIPLFAAAFSLLTTYLTEQEVHKHVSDSEARIKAHVEHHIGKSEERIKAHVTKAGGQDEVL